MNVAVSLFCLGLTDGQFSFNQEFFKLSDVEDVGLVEKAALANQVDDLIDELFDLQEKRVSVIPVEMVKYVGMSRIISLFSVSHA